MKEYKYIVLKGPQGNVFWTTLTPSADYKKEGFEVLLKTDDSEKAKEEWRKHYNGC